MKVAGLLSGGKDSVYATSIAQQYGWEITNLISLIPENTESWMFHSVNTHMTSVIAECMEIPLVQKKTQGQKEEELIDLQNILAELDIDGVISGALASEYQRTRIEKICYELNLKSFTPLWHKKQKTILTDQLNAGLTTIIVGVSAYGFDETWLGRIIDKKCIDELIKLEKKYQINIAGEGGEFETLVTNAPFFKKRIIIEETQKEWHRDNGRLHILKSHTEEKSLGYQ